MLIAALSFAACNNATESTDTVEETEMHEGHDHAEEAADEEIKLGSGVEDLVNMNSDLVHPLTGPVYVEGAEPGDVLAVTLHKVEIGDWGWVGIFPGFGLLADEFTDPYLKTYDLNCIN